MSESVVQQLSEKANIIWSSHFLCFSPFWHLISVHEHSGCSFPHSIVLDLDKLLVRSWLSALLKTLLL